MDITITQTVAASTTPRDRSVRPQASYRLVSPVAAVRWGTAVPAAGLVASGALTGADAMTHPSVDDSFRRGRPPV